MPIRRVRRKFEQWRQEPEEVRLRIATLLTAGVGLAGTLLWLFILLPLQLHLTRPPESTDEATRTAGQIGGIQDIPSPTPTPTPEVKYYHETRPSQQDSND